MKYVQLPNGMTVRDVSRAGALAVYDEIFRRNCYQQFGIDVKDGDVIVDLGANIGMFCLWLGRLRATVEDGETIINMLDATVHALEPIRETFLSLVENLNYNVKRLRVRPWNAAVGFGCGETGLADFRTCPRLSQVASMFPWSKEKETANRAYIVEQMNRWPWAAVSWMVPGRVKAWLAERIRRWYMRHETERCQVWSFAEMVRNLNLSRIDLLKIDVEGAELGIFDGMSDEHFAMVRQLVVEVHEYDDLGPIEVTLEHRGFAVHTELFPPPGLAMVYAVKKSVVTNPLSGVTGQPAPALFWRNPAADASAPSMPTGIWSNLTCGQQVERPLAMQRERTPEPASIARTVESAGNSSDSIPMRDAVGLNPERETLPRITGFGPNTE